MAKVKVTLTKSVIGKPQTQRETVKALGLNKMHKTVEHEDTPQLRGQVAKVAHLVTVEEN
ncbi:50S ribosomal protein L30 [Jeotgalicoccus coquinae]|uniref:Large ribosomal subunit protein uL30 n=1 Tax=Jeotgalicoccus coquinae TaxID=709509 RepID=A0A6V7R437_9STAP|nr:50S ribosomal protein L30 [Jeotgalicoccus coquinae]MBB6423390.1 large subunit ribosomal protein L30 [Jeotgalicoccus coquinae]GGE19519.1 50S ribosomal protein L30 [Jeotgalicoccus coquinae]CAD2071814.1 50S ribosomal protein L30 [Jeotgalicoccus coquinae]